MYFSPSFTFRTNSVDAALRGILCGVFTVCNRTRYGGTDKACMRYLGLFSFTKQRMVKCVLIELNLLSTLLPGPKITMLPKS